MKLGYISLLALVALSASTMHAQLAYTNEGATAFGSDERSNSHDQAILGSLGAQSSFTLDSLPGLTFSDVSGSLLANEFAVGNNGSFTVSAEVAFVYRNAIDADQLASFGLAGTDTTLFSSSDPSGLNSTIKISGTGSNASAANFATFKWSDLSTGQSSTMFDTNGVKVFESTDDPNYNYYVFGNEDRKGTYDKDFNDFNLLVRINTAEVGFTPVPEPSTYALWGAAGLLGVCAFRSRRRNRAASAA